MAYKATNKIVVRAGYGIFYGGDEAGPYSNPSMGFNPPFFVNENFNQPCGDIVGQSGDRGLFPAWHTYAGQWLPGKFADRS